MKNFRDYEQLIRDTVKEIDAKDTNWNFSIHSISKERVSIRWTYLDYCEEKDNCFFLTLSGYDEEDNDYWLSAMTPDMAVCIEGYFCTENEVKKSWQQSYESALVDAIHEIAYYAHSRY